MSRWYFDPSSQNCDKVVEVGLWPPITQACICKNVDPLWCLLRQFMSRGKISTERKFIREFQDLTVFFTSPAQYELLFDSGSFGTHWFQKYLPRHPTFNFEFRSRRTHAACMYELLILILMLPAPTSLDLRRFTKPCDHLGDYNNKKYMSNVS